MYTVNAMKMSGGNINNKFICKIIERQVGPAGDPDSKVIGTGCLTRSAVQGSDLNVATSKNIIQDHPKNLFVVFTDNESKELKLSSPDKAFKTSEIAYFNTEKSFLTSECFVRIPRQCQDSRQDEIKLQVVVTYKSLDRNEIVALPVVFESDQFLRVCPEHACVNLVALDDLAVRGSPILAFHENSQHGMFWGIVDSFQTAKDNKILLKTIRYTSNEDKVHRQETEQPGLGNGKFKLSSDATLEKLWKDQFFQDSLSNPLDMEYHSVGKKIKNWRHLAQLFDVPDEDRDRIASSMSCPTSSAERLFDYMQAKWPNCSIKKLRKTFEDAKVHQVLRQFNDVIEKGIEEGNIKYEDPFSVLADKYPVLMENIIIKLDSRDLWRKVAQALKIPKNKCSSFTRDPKFNPTREVFEILRTQSPNIPISTFKMHLAKLEQKEILEHMKSIQDYSLLKDLSSEAVLMCDVIEPKFNDTANNLLYKLAELFKEEGYLRGVDINDFRASERQGSPTCEVIDIVLATSPKEYYIKDLVDYLLKIERNDCVEIVKQYVNDPETLAQMTQDFESHLTVTSGKPDKPPPIEREVSTMDD